MMGCKTRRLLRCLCFVLLSLISAAQDENLRSCRTAPCDLVFILDGSWSVLDFNFEIVKRWLVNITTSFNIGQKFTQVGVVQYSDDPILEIPLGKFSSNKDLIKAMQKIDYMGGNTRTGTAIKFATDKLFGLSERGPAGISRIAVVLTDGKSQDEVMKAAEEARKKGIILFAIGVGSETEENELRDIANKPSTTYVFSVEDYKAITRIIQVIRQKLCEETVCPAKIPIDSRDEKGFDILLKLNLAKKTKKTQGPSYGTKAYEVTSFVDLSEATRSLFPDGFPPSYVFVATLRYKGSVAVEKWDLWRIQTHDEDPQMAVTLNGLDNTVMFTTTSNTPNAIQTVTFSQQTAKKLFDEKWHQLRLLVTEEDVTLYVDDLQMETQPLEPSVGIFINGKTQVGKYVNKEITVPVKHQRNCIAPTMLILLNQHRNLVLVLLDLLDHQEQQGKEEARVSLDNLDLLVLMVSLVFLALEDFLGFQVHQDLRGHKEQMGTKASKGDRVFWANGVCLDYLDCQGSKEKRDFLGEKEKMEFKEVLGEAGAIGIPGSDGRQGHPGVPGLPGNAGLNGQKGETGEPGPKGIKGSAGPSVSAKSLNYMHGLGELGLPGEPGMKGPIGPKGERGNTGETGMMGMKGDQGEHGRPGVPGSPGPVGFKGEGGIIARKGQQGIQGREGQKVKWDGLDNQVSQGQLGPKECEGTQAPLGHRGPKADLVAVQDVKASRGHLVHKVQLVPKDSEVFLDLVVLEDNLVVQDENRVTKVRKGTLVKLWLGIRDLLGHQGLLVPRGTANQVLLVSLDFLVKMEQRVNQVIPVCLAIP
ncbi:hypothetical protein CCH79_00001562, partial [Gambusia affinis]